MAQDKGNKRKENILVFCAHSDDQIFGVGGTIAKYAKYGADVHTVIVYYGEDSHPWLKSKVTVKMRVREAQKADKIMGGHGVMFLGFKDENPKEIEARIRKIIHYRKPTKIFTHVNDDRALYLAGAPQPHHKKVFEMVMNSIDKRMFCDVYCFDVWNPFFFRKSDCPIMYVDITDTFHTKIEALKCFGSQWISMIMLMWNVYASAIINGFKNKSRYAEKFYKLK